VVTSVLTNLLKKITKLEQTERGKRVIQELRQHLTITLILTLPVESNEFTIYNDVLKNDLGGVLMREEKVLVYASWQLKPYERNYPLLI